MTKKLKTVSIPITRNFDPSNILGIVSIDPDTNKMTAEFKIGYSIGTIGKMLGTAAIKIIKKDPEVPNKIMKVEIEGYALGIYDE